MGRIAASAPQAMAVDDATYTGGTPFVVRQHGNFMHDTTTQPTFVTSPSPTTRQPVTQQMFVDNDNEDENNVAAHTRHPSAVDSPEPQEVCVCVCVCVCVRVCSLRCPLEHLLACKYIAQSQQV